MFHLLAQLKAEAAAWLALSRSGRNRFAQVLGLDDPPTDAPPALPPAPEPVTSDKRKR